MSTCRGIRILPEGDDRRAARRYDVDVMRDWLHPDRPLSRAPIWFLADTLIALLFVWVTVESLRSDAYVSEYGAIRGWGWLLAVSPAFLLIVRRLAPATTLAGATVLYMVISGVQGDSNAPLAVPFFAYAVGMSRPSQISGWMVGAAGVAMSTSVFYGPGDPVYLAIPVTLLLFGVGWLVAVVIRRNQTLASEFADEADELRIQAAEAVAEERSRLARELHDAVGHAVNVMVMQAGAARLGSSEEQSSRAFSEIERIGRSALTDLDHMLGLLHDGNGLPAPLQPIRGIGDITRLVDATRSGGADVHLHDRCASLVEELDQSIGAAAYRIVQESLTNAIKHAGSARVDVTLDCQAGDLHLTVTDDGRGPEPGGGVGSGRGIAGMTERAKVLGGRLTAHPGPQGGFVVEAHLPLRRGKRTAAHPGTAGAP